METEYSTVNDHDQTDVIVDKIQGIIETAAKKHGVESDDIENYIDTALINEGNKKWLLQQER